MPTEASPVPSAEGPGPLPRAVWAVSVTSLFSDWSYEMLLPVLPFFLVYVLHASVVVVGLVEGLAVLSQALAQPISSHFVRTAAARKKGGIAGYSVTTAAHGALTVTTGWLGVLALRVTAWSGRGWRQPIKKTIVTNAVGGKRRGVALGLEQAFDSLGAVLGTAVAVLLILQEGLAGSARTIFAVSVVPGLIAVLVFAICVREPRATPPPQEPSALRSDRPALPSRVRWFLVAATLFGLGFFNILLAVLNIGETVQTSRPLGGDLGQASAVVFALVVYLLYNLVYAAASLPVGRIADRAPGIGLVAASYLLFLPVDVLLILETGVAGAVALMLAAGLQIALLDVAESAWLSRSVPPEQVGTVFGWFGGLRGVGSLAGSVLIGVLWESVSVPVAFSVSAVFVVAAAVVLLVAVRPSSPARR